MQTFIYRLITLDNNLVTFDYSYVTLNRKYVTLINILERYVNK